MSYHELNLEKRIAIRVGLLEKVSLREIARQLRNLCISPQRMCLHMRAECGSIPAHAAN